MLPHLYPRRRVPTLLFAAGCVLAVGFPERTAAQVDTYLVYVSVMQEEKRKGEGEDTRLLSQSLNLFYLYLYYCYCLHLGMQCWGGWGRAVLVTVLLCGAWCFNGCRVGRGG